MSVIITNQPCLCMWTTLMNEPCIYALIWLLFYVWAEMIAILLFRMYSPVPSKPFSWLSCLICWMDVVRYLSSFSMDLEVKECAAWWHDDNTSLDVKRLKEVMLSKIWFLFEIKTLIISPVCLCLQWLKMTPLFFREGTADGWNGASIWNI